MFEAPDLDEILGNGLDEDSDEDALASIDTNLPEWLTPSEPALESKPSVPDWITEEEPELGFDADEQDDNLVESDQEPSRSSATGLLRKLG